MAIAESILPEFDHEMANTRKTIERIPAGKLEWRAHPKSNTLGWLGSHLAEIPGWARSTLEQESLDLNPTGGAPYRTAIKGSVAAMLDTFDKNVAAARKLIADTPDPDYMVPWSLLSAGETIFTMPRIAVLRSFVLSHIIHHRAILTVYLRLNDVPVPALYGPSGDETF